MKIKKHGTNISKEYGKEKFVCEYCGCEFVANRDEYYSMTKQSDSCAYLTSTCISYNTTTIDIFICSCPECHRILEKERTRDDTDNTEITVNQCVMGENSVGYQED